MKTGILVITLLLTAMQWAYAADADKKQEKAKESGGFTQGEKGKAKEALEQSAGQKTSDVKVPDVPKPTPVK